MFSISRRTFEENIRESSPFRPGISYFSSSSKDSFMRVFDKPEHNRNSSFSTVKQFSSPINIRNTTLTIGSPVGHRHPNGLVSETRTNAIRVRSGALYSHYRPDGAYKGTKIKENSISPQLKCPHCNLIALRANEWEPMIALAISTSV